MLSKCSLSLGCVLHPGSNLTFPRGLHLEETIMVSLWYFEHLYFVLSMFVYQAGLSWYDLYALAQLGVFHLAWHWTIHSDGFLT